MEDVSNSMVRTLYNHGKSFLSVFSSRYLRRNITELPFLYLDITNRCNSRCISCDLWKNEKSKDELTTEEILSMIDSLKQLNTKIVSIGGGEATLRGDLEECIAAFHEAGMVVHLNSNGINISRERVDSLIRAGLSVIYISCDHVTPEGYKQVRGLDRFDRVRQTVRAFREHPTPISVGLNFVVSRANADQIKEMVDLGLDWGVQKLQFIPVHDNLQQREMEKSELKGLIPTEQELKTIKADVKEAVKRLKQHGLQSNSDFFINNFEYAYRAERRVPCFAGTLFVLVNSFGEIFPCYEYATNLNIRNNSLATLVRSKEYKEALKHVASCKEACFDNGSAEPSIRFYLPYLVSHLPEIVNEAKLHDID